MKNNTRLRACQVNRRRIQKMLAMNSTPSARSTASPSFTLGRPTAALSCRTATGAWGFEELATAYNMSPYELEQTHVRPKMAASGGRPFRLAKICAELVTYAEGGDVYGDVQAVMIDPSSP